MRNDWKKFAHACAPFVFALIFCPGSDVIGQNADTTGGRADQIQQERKEKAAHMRPEETPTLQKQFVALNRLIDRSPIRAGVRGLGPGAGPTVGFMFERSSFGDEVRGKLWGMGSLHRFYSAGTGVEFRTFAAQDVVFFLEGSHSDAPQLEYYGPGPDSSIHKQTNFRREDTAFDFGAEVHGSRHLSERCRLRQLLLNVGPGTNESLSSTETVFGPAEAPGIDVQSDFSIAGCSAELDLLDFREDPHKGLHAAASYDRYFAQNDRHFSFHRVSAAAEEYIPFLNRKRVVAVAARTELSFHSENQIVPFYLQPTLASDIDLRGFRRYRFYDENSISLNAEYRWEINTGFDMALFTDFGKVFHKPGEIGFSGMEASAGFGLRFKNRRSVIARLDTGFSREGVQVWLKVGRFF